MLKYLLWCHIAFDNAANLLKWLGVTTGLEKESPSETDQTTGSAKESANANSDAQQGLSLNYETVGVKQCTKDI